MISQVIRCGLIALAMLVFSGGWVLPAAALDRGKIADVRVSPDLRRVVIKSDGPLGDHKAFVIGQPYRLVLDFPDADLARGLSRIKVGKEPIREIRLGSTASRTRVVVDFGHNAAPPYKIHRDRGYLVVTLGQSLPVPRQIAAEKKKASAPKPETKSPPKQARGPAKKKNSPLLKIRSAEVVDGLVVVELTEAKRPKRSCKLVLEVDLDRMKVSRAVLNDGKGNLSCEDLKAKATKKPANSESAEPARGPRKAAAEKTSAPPKKSRYQWGLPKVETRGPTKSRKPRVGPLRVEGFSLTTAAVTENNL